MGRHIRRLRDARQWSIEELADRAQIDPGYLGKIELGKRNPSLKKIVCIATALDVEPRHILMRELSD